MKRPVSFDRWQLINGSQVIPVFVFSPEVRPLPRAARGGALFTERAPTSGEVV